MSPSDPLTLSLLDPDQGVCPDGHPCRLSDAIGERVCDHGEYRALALICWEITPHGIDAADRAGAQPEVVAWARLFIEERGTF
jgi:hypothetical protein